MATETPDTEAQQQPSPYEELEKGLGQAVQALAQSSMYASRTVKEMYEQLLPALVTRQYRVVRNKEGQTVAYISWALVSDEVEKKLESGDQLALGDWQSGDIGMLVDVVAKNAAAGNLLVGRLKSELFKDKPLKAMRVQDGKPELMEVPAAAEMPAAGNGAS